MPLFFLVLLLHERERGRRQTLSLSLENPSYLSLVLASRKRRERRDTPRKKSFSFPAPKEGFGHHRRPEKKDNGMNVNASLDIPLFSLPVIKLAAAFDNLVSREEGAFPKKKVYPRPLTSPPPFRPNTLIQRGKRGEDLISIPAPRPSPPSPPSLPHHPTQRLLLDEKSCWASRKESWLGLYPPSPFFILGKGKKEDFFSPGAC